MLHEQDIPDIFNLEFQLQKNINELQWKSNALKQTEEELLQVRQELLNKEVISEDRKRTINDLTIQLTTAHQVIEWIEKEKNKYMNERTQLQINCNTAVKERESLLEQTHAAKLENMTLKLNIQKLTETISTNKSIKKALETSFYEMQERFLQINNSLHSNIVKLEKEHKFLLESVESTIELNRRLQTVGLCAHAVYTKKNEEIKNLQNEVALHAQVNTIVSQIHSTEVIDIKRRSKFDAKAILEQVRADAEKDYETDNQIDIILTDFENVS